MKGVTRRLAIQLFGGGVVSLPQAKEIAPKLFSDAAIAAAVTSQPQPGAPVSGAVSRFGKLLGGQMDDWRTAAESEEGNAYSFRAGGLDADLVAMKSWSHAYKITKQAKRNTETRTLMRAWEKLIWG